jgi:hypothetical protein
MPSKADASKLLQTSIRPALQAIGRWSLAAEELVLGTAIVESGLVNRVQLGGGPARGLFQMEPATHDDIWSNYLKYRPTLAQSVRALSTGASASELMTNDRYAAAMARVQYLRAPTPLPQAGDLSGQAAYWKDYYNTCAGKGTPGKYVQAWRGAMGAA